MEGQDSLLEPYKRTRRTDPETSLAAAASVTKITEKQEAVLHVLKLAGPMTDEDIRRTFSRWYHGEDWQVSPQSESGLRTRRSELVRRGLVRHSGEYRTLVSGRQARVWEAVQPVLPVHNPYGHATTRHEIDEAFDE